jgi:hypothetical protein
MRPGDYWVALALFLVALALRLPFRSQMAYHWDSAEFALAIREYNVALSQPHAPGYFLYVMIGRLVNWFLGDPHASLVWMSVLGGSGLVAVLYLLGTAMFGRRTGLAAGLFAMTSPQMWFHSCVALTYAVDAFLVCTLVLFLWRGMQSGSRWSYAALIGGVLALVGGVRPQTLPGIIPLVAYALWRMRGPRLATLTVALGAAALGTLTWLVPMIRMSGGWAVYAEAVHRHAAFNASVTVAARGTDALLWNVFFASLYCLNGLMLGAVPLVCALFVRVFMDPARKGSWDAAHIEAMKVMALWIVPMMFMATTVAFTKQPGYVLSYLPAWLLVVAVIVAQLRKRWMYTGTMTVICAVNVFAFVAWPRTWDRVFFGMGRTAREIRVHDHQLARMILAVRTRLNPADAVICHAYEYLPLGLRHLQLYLPEFEQYQLAIDRTMLSPADRPVMSIRGGRLDFVHEPDLTGKRIVALVVPKGTSLEDYAAHFDLRDARPLPGSGGHVYTVPAEAKR